MRLLLDEMYSPAIAEGLRERGHDVISAHDRSDLAGARDAQLFAAMQAEQRVIVTNNIRDFTSLANQALQTGSAFYGLIFTSDKSLPRRKTTIGTFVRLLETLINRYPPVNGLAGQVYWLTNA